MFLLLIYLNMKKRPIQKAIVDFNLALAIAE